jgi:hypothetical protein
MRRPVPAALLALSCSACSVLFMETLPDQRHRRQVPHCTASSGFIVWDGALVAVHAVSAVVGIVAATEADGFGELPAVQRGLLGANLFAAVMHGFSASYGAKQVRRCKAARDEYDRTTSSPAR